MAVGWSQAGAMAVSWSQAGAMAVGWSQAGAMAVGSLQAGAMAVISNIIRVQLHVNHDSHTSERVLIDRTVR